MSWVPPKYHYQTGTHCWFCDREFGVDKPLWLVNSGAVIHRTKEHIIPLAKGGVNAPYNYVASCNECNGLKGSRDAVGFAIKVEHMMFTFGKGTHNMYRLFQLMRDRAWKLYNKTSKLHKKFKAAD